MASEKVVRNLNEFPMSSGKKKDSLTNKTPILEKTKSDHVIQPYTVQMARDDNNHLLYS